MSEPDVTPDLKVPWEEDPGDLYEHAPCGYLTTLPDGTIVKVNTTFLTWTGYERTDLIGRRRFRDLLTPGGQIYHETHYAPLLNMQDDVHEIAFDILRQDGSRLATLVNSALGRDPQGLPRVIRTTVFNATERRGYEQELLYARRAAEASERRVRVLQQIVADLSAAPTAREVAEAVIRAPGPAFGAAGSTLWLADPEAGRLAEVATTEHGPAECTRSAAEVARRADLSVLGSVAEAERRLPELAAAMRRSGHGSAVLLPLTAATTDNPDAVEVLGVLAFVFTDERTLTDSELRVVQLLGQQAGQALDRARLYDDARRREDRATFLAETTRALDEIPRLLPRARRLAELIVPKVAEWAAIRLQVGTNGVVADVGGPSPDPDRLIDLRTAVTTSGEAHGGGDGEPYVLPLTARGRVLGTLALRPAPDGGTGPGQAVFLRDLADRAALSLENARLYEQERAIARTLQRSLLAGEMPADNRFAVETHYQAAALDLEVGGDWFDAFLISPDKLAVVVGDVVGRGIDAATTMGQLRQAVRALAFEEAGPARLLERLDRFVERVDSARMATVAYAEVMLASGEMTYACAGHLPPLVQEPAGPPRYLLQARSAALGSRAGRTERIEQTVQLSPGSRLLLYTDGLIERRGQPLDTGFELLARDFTRRRDAPIEGLTAAIAETLVSPEHADDVCLLCLVLGREERMQRSIGADPMQIARLRRDLRNWLAANAVDAESTEAVLLACSEAVANAIEHGYRDDPFGTVEVSATVSARVVEIRVADRGTWRPARTDVARGRGLQLIRQVMDQVGFERGGGTTVTMRRTRKEAR